MNEFVREYIEYRKGVKKDSETTLKSIKYDIGYLLSYLNTDDVLSITTKQIESYLSSYDGRTFNKRLSVYKSFFKWLQKIKKVRQDDPSLDIDCVDVNKKKPKYLREEDIIKLIDAPEGRNQHRDKAILSVFCFCGVRISEIINIKLKHITKEKDGYILEIPNGKGDKERHVSLPEECYIAISEYYHNNKLRKESKCEYVFISMNNKQMCISAVANVVNDNLKKIGRESLSPHKLRHTFATLYYAATQDILSLQEALGHESIKTTEIYTQMDNAQKIKNTKIFMESLKK